jgi:hypothetical protein
MLTGTNGATGLALGESVAAAAASWARRRMADVRAEGRSVTGGWPGTRSEARRIVAEQVAASGARPGHDEIECLVTRAYSRARETWLAGAVGDDDPTDPHTT